MQIMSDVVEEIICYMENHTDFARRQVAKLGVLGDEKNTIVWAELSKILNALGQVKSPEQWQAFWRKIRLASKKTFGQYLKNLYGTGNKNNEVQLSDIDKRIATIFGKIGTGLPIVNEVGIIAQKDRVNPLDYFDKCLNIKKSGKGKKTIQDVTQEQRIHMCSIMPNNPKYACNEEQDCMERIRISGKLVSELNALRGAKKENVSWDTR